MGRVIGFDNFANTFRSFLKNAATAARTWTFPDFDGNVILDTSPEVLAGTLTTYSPSVTGFSTSPTIVGKYLLFGKLCFVYITVNPAGNNGTSNATTFTVTLPFTAQASNLQTGFISTLNNTTTWSTGMIVTRTGSNIADLYTSGNFVAFTAAGQKACVIGFWFETA
jgi:hypothetical protein